MCTVKTPWEKAVEFHGHSCPGLAIGFKAVEAVIRELGYARDIDEEMVAIVENDSCSIDAIQSELGCTAGKGNLIFRNNGKQVFTVGRRNDGKAVRIALKYDTRLGSGNDESREDRIKRILESDPGDLFDIKEAKLDLPKKAVIFKTIKCEGCGEGVMESKVRLSDGRPLCPDCFDDYTRGW
ncbi:FmdE family protein [Phosphitispora sp. TUW77]|uniref:FmdE family protein n=1 Tax=Phosphitispora sp. TUW77 TaxID=3152361 RepID=UPI003AB52B2E